MRISVTFPEKHAHSVARVLRMGLIAAGVTPTDVPRSLRRKLTDWYKRHLNWDRIPGGIRVVKGGKR